MSKLTVLAGGKELDLVKGVGFGLNYSIDDVRNPDKKNTNYSKTILLAGSKSNHQLLGGLFDVNADFTFFNPNKKVDSKIILDSTTVLDGFLQLVSIDKVGDNIVYSCLIKNITVDFFSKIKNKKLNELDLQDYIHEYSHTNVVASWTNTYKDVFVYHQPKSSGSSGIVMLSDYKPAIFHKALTLRILSEAGYNIKGDLFDDSTEIGAHYAKEIIPFTGHEVQTVYAEQASLNSFRVGLGVGILPNINLVSKTISSNIDNLYNIDPTLIPLDNDSSIVPMYSDVGDNFNTTTSEYVAQEDAVVDLRFSLRLNIKHSTASTEAYQQVKTFDYLDNVISVENNKDYEYRAVAFFYRNGVVLGSERVQLLTSPSATVGVSTFNAGNGYEVLETNTLYVSFDNLDVNQGDVITVQLKVLDDNLKTSGVLQYSSTEFGDTLVDVDVDYISDFSNLIATSKRIGVVSGINVLNDYISPEAKQSDLITDLIKRYNGYISVDPEDETTIFFNVRSVYYDTGGTLDWTNKKDYSKKDKIKFLTELQNKELEIGYSKSDDDVNKGYSKISDGDIFGTKKIEFDNDFTKGVKKIQTPFKSTPIVYSNADMVSLSGDYSGGGLRVLYYGGLKDCLNDGAFGLTIETILFGQPALLSLSTHTQYPYAGHYDDPVNPTIDLNFGTLEEDYGYADSLQNTNGDLYNRFWQEYIEQINTGRLVTMYFNLNEVDIGFIKDNLNYKIYVKDSYYRINKIIDYNPVKSTTTKVELLKIDDGVSFTPIESVKTGEFSLPDVLGRLGDFDPSNPDYSKQSDVVGLSNSVGEGSDYSTIKGVGNIIGTNSPKSIIIGDNNIISGGIEGAFIIGASNKTITTSGTGWIGETEITNGTVAEPYKVYSFLISQSSQDDPNQTVLRDTLNNEITLERTDRGIYTIDSNEAFTDSKTAVLISSNSVIDIKIQTNISSASNINLLVGNSEGTLDDDLLDGAFIEIRVYS